MGMEEDLAKIVAGQHLPQSVDREKLISWIYSLPPKTDFLVLALTEDEECNAKLAYGQQATDHNAILMCRFYLGLKSNPMLENLQSILRMLGRQGPFG